MTNASEPQDEERTSHEDAPQAQSRSDHSGSSRSERRAYTLGMFGLLLAMGLLAWGHVFEVGGAFSKAAAARVRVNVNRADADTLALLPEIGKDRAAKIVEYRTEHGPFHGYPDLLRVTGIGEKTVEKLIHEICFSDEPAPAEPAQSSEDRR